MSSREADTNVALGPSPGRYLVARALVGLTVAGIVAIPAAHAPVLLAPALAAWVGISSALAFPLVRGGSGGTGLCLAVLLLLDLIAQALVVAVTGAATSPFVLVFSLTIASAGSFLGLRGAVVAASVAAIGFWGAILRLGQPIGIAPLLTGFFLLVLGLLFGRLGRRVVSQSIEMNRVRDELERIRMDAETIVASLTGPLLCLDRTGKIRRINLTAARLLGLEGDILGERLDRVGSRERIGPLLQFVREVFRGGDCSTEIEMPWPDGRPATPVEVSASGVRDRDGEVQGIVVLLSDLTRRRDLEAEQARKERLAAIGELSGHLAHEIRNSLKPVVGSIELLSREVPREATAGELLSIILRESESLEAFLSDFLTLSRDKPLTVGPFDLDELIEEQVAALTCHPARRDTVTIRRAPGSGGGVISADRGAVRDILRNLLINGLEATVDGRIEVSCRPDGPDLEVLIEDTGTGLPEGDPERLFEPFLTHKPGGTGLGLSIARNLARRMSGEVTLEPIDGVGARSRLLLRRCRAERRAA